MTGVDSPRIRGEHFCAEGPGCFKSAASRGPCILREESISFGVTGTPGSHLAGIPCVLEAPEEADLIVPANIRMILIVLCQVGRERPGKT